MSELTFTLDADDTAILELKLGQYIVGDTGPRGQDGPPGPEGTLTPDDTAAIDKAVSDSQAAASAASGSATASGNSATNAANSAASAASARDAASASATAAATSQSAAAGSASAADASNTSAGSAAAAAGASQTAAKTSETNSKTSETNSAASAAAAAASQGAAHTSEVNAAASASAAANSAASINPATYVQKTGDTMTGPLVVPAVTFSGLGSRILADFSNGTAANSALFQTSTPNSATTVGTMPSGTNTTAVWRAYSKSDPANCAFMQMGITDAGSAFLNTNVLGSGVQVPMLFNTAAAERMRIGTDGTVHVNEQISWPNNIQHSTTSLNAANRWAVGAYCVAPSGGCLLCRTDNTGSSLAGFYYTSTLVGGISTNGTATSFNTSSDYRLKKNVQPLADALATVQAVRPVSFDWISSGEPDTGMIAHELQAVIPGAVTGNLDALTRDGTIDPQMVDYSKLVPFLVGAIQQLAARVEYLEGFLNV